MLSWIEDNLANIIIVIVLAIIIAANIIYKIRCKKQGKSSCGCGSSSCSSGNSHSKKE